MRKYRLRIGLDVDDVLYKCNAHALDLLKKKYGDLPEFDLNNIRSWGPQGNLSDERIAMFSDPEFVSSQPMYEGAQKFVRELCRIADVFFVTAVPPRCMSARALRLTEDFPEVPAGNILIGTRKDVIDLDILLDDAEHNIFSSRATYPVLMRRPWNGGLSGLLSVNTYTDFLHLARMIRDSFVAKAPDLSKGGVVCLVGPSGTGKNEIAAELVSDKRFVKPLTTTTRPRYESERANAYRFVSEEQFLAEKDAGKFLETTVYSSYHFGTSESEIDPIVESGRIAVIPIDVCGALTIRNRYSSRAMLVFTERAKEQIYMELLRRKIGDEDKVRRMLSLDFELRNAELCDLSVNFDAGAASCADRVREAIDRPHAHPHAAHEKN